MIRAGFFPGLKRYVMSFCRTVTVWYRWPVAGDVCFTLSPSVGLCTGVEPAEEESPPDASPAGGDSPAFQPSYLTYPAMTVDLTPSRLTNGDGGAAGEPTTAPPNGTDAKQPAPVSAAPPAAVPTVPAVPAVHTVPPRPVKGAIPDDGTLESLRRPVIPRDTVQVTGGGGVGAGPG